MSGDDISVVSDYELGVSQDLLISESGACEAAGQLLNRSVLL